MGAIQVLELEPKRNGQMATPDAEPHMDSATAGGDATWNTRFAALANEHSRLLFRIAFSLLRNAHDAEDAVQEALLRIYKSGCNREKSGLHNSAAEQIANEKAYLARTVWRAGLDIAACRPKRTESLDGLTDSHTTNTPREFPADLPTAEQALAEGDERALLRRLIDSLPEDLRQPLVLSAIEEMTSREVAAALSIPEGTVRTRIMRARAELRKRFQMIRARRAAPDR